MVIDVQQFERCFGKIDTQRVLRAEDPSTSETERNELYRKVWNNRLVRLRREVRGHCKEQRRLSEIIFSLCTKLENENSKTFINQYLIEDLEEELEFYSKKEEITREIIANLGKTVSNLLPFYEQLASDHDFAQIINANIREVERCREDYMKRVAEGEIKPDDCFFTTLVFVYKIESEDDCPFMEAMWQLLAQQILENKELKSQVWNKAEECFPNLRDCMVTLNEDENSQLVGRKYYPPLKLIK